MNKHRISSTFKRSETNRALMHNHAMMFAWYHRLLEFEKELSAMMARQKVILNIFANHRVFFSCFEGKTLEMSEIRYYQVVILNITIEHWKLLVFINFHWNRSDSHPISFCNIIYDSIHHRPLNDPLKVCFCLYKKTEILRALINELNQFPWE